LYSILQLRREHFEVNREESMRKETTICWIKIDGREVDILADLAIGKG
jgi:hypothetical protein